MDFLKIKMIVAYANNNVIGCNGQIPWKISEDLKRFKTLTMGHVVVMGRKTYESLPGGALPNRENIVLSENLNYELKDAKVVRSVPELFHLLEEKFRHREIFIIGGGSIYKNLLPYTDTIMATEVHKEVEGDTHFPLLSTRVWKERSREKCQNKEYTFDYVTYTRF